MRGHEEQHAGAKHQDAKTHGEHGRPAQTAASRILFELAYAIGGGWIKQISVHPPLKIFLPAHRAPCRGPLAAVLPAKRKYLRNLVYDGPSVPLPTGGALSKACNSLQLENPWYRRKKTKPWNSSMSHACPSSTSAPSIA